MGSVSFIDLIAARAAIKTGADREKVRSLLMDLDAGKGEGSFVESLLKRSILDAEHIERTKTLARQYFFMRNETAYLHYLKQVPNIDGQRVAQLRDGQAKAGYRDRIGTLLVRDGLIDETADKQIGERARGALQRENNKQLDLYRGRQFQGIENLGQTTARQPAPVDVKPPAAPAANGAAKTAPPDKASAPADKPGDESNPMISSLKALFGDSSDGAAGPSASEETSAEAADGIPTRPLSSLGPKGDGIPTRPLSALDKAEAPAVEAVDDEATDDGDDPSEAIAAALGDPLKGTGLESRYRLRSKLGQGGMGAVYLAEDLQESNRLVALKIALPDHENEDGFGRFKREILCNSFLEHPNIVSVYDGGENANGTYFMAMEYVEGEPYSERMKREGMPTVAVGLEIVEQVLEALIAAHTVRVVHRDLKPENFMCYDKEDGGIGIKLMDFGIARILDDEQQFSDQFFQTNIGQITGSPAYVAPESITEPQIDERADLYTLGVILFEFCVGRLPFRGKDPSEYLAKHLYADPPDPREQAPHRGIAPALSEMIKKLMAKKPRERYPSAQAVLEDLRQNVLPSYKRDQTQVLTGRLTPTKLKQVLDEAESRPDARGGGKTEEDLGPTELDISPPQRPTPKAEPAPAAKRTGALRALADAAVTAIKPAPKIAKAPETDKAPVAKTGAAAIDARAPAKPAPEAPKPQPTAKPVTKPITPPLPPPEPNPEPRPGFFRRLLRAIFGK